MSQRSPSPEVNERHRDSILFSLEPIKIPRQPLFMLENVFSGPKIMKELGNHDYL